MLTGKLPFATFTPLQMARRQMTELPPPPSTRRPNPVSPELEALVMRALAPLREHRPGSAEEMREQLLRCPVEAAPPRVTPAVASATVVMPRPNGKTPAASGPGPIDEPGTTSHMEAPPTAVAPAEPPRRTTGSSLDPEAVKTVALRALQLLGPVAPYLVRKATATVATLPELVEKVASFLPSEKERTAFLSAFPSPRPAPALTRARAPANVAWDPAVLDRIGRLLAIHIGPVARVVVQRASARARDPLELCDMVASEIANESDRASFLKSVGPPDPAWTK
jgi:serine/threonine-protein kinase